MSEVKSGGVIRYARARLGISQESFSRWLSDKMGKESVRADLISKWELGARTPRMAPRLACREIAARAALEQIGVVDITDEDIAMIVDSQS